MSDAVRWNVSVRKALESGGHRFTLDIAFRSNATRLVLFGPSGAGKSLTLKAIAGLLRPDQGCIALDGETLFDAQAGIDLPAGERRLGYLFQEYALFPHLTVRQNVSFGLSRGLSNPGRRASPATADRWLDTLEIRALADRYPDQLSGGSGSARAGARPGRRAARADARRAFAARWCCASGCATSCASCSRASACRFSSSPTTKPMLRPSPTMSSASRRAVSPSTSVLPIRSRP